MSVVAGVFVGPQDVVFDALKPVIRHWTTLKSALDTKSPLLGGGAGTTNPSEHLIESLNVCVNVPATSTVVGTTVGNHGELMGSRIIGVGAVLIGSPKPVGDDGSGHTVSAYTL